MDSDEAKKLQPSPTVHAVSYSGRPSYRMRHVYIKTTVRAMHSSTNEIALAEDAEADSVSDHHMERRTPGDITAEESRKTATASRIGLLAGGE